MTSSELKRPPPSHARHPRKQTALKTLTPLPKTPVCPLPGGSFHSPSSTTFPPLIDPRSRTESNPRCPGWKTSHELAGMPVISRRLGGGQSLCPHAVNHSPQLPLWPINAGTAAFWCTPHSPPPFKLTRSLGAGHLSGHDPRQSCGRHQSPDVQERTCGLESGGGRGGVWGGGQGHRTETKQA